MTVAPPLNHPEQAARNQAKKPANEYLILCAALITVVIGIFLTFLKVPAAFLSTGMVVGLILTFTWKTPVALSSKSSTAISTLIGVLLGTYLDISAIKQMKSETFYIVLLSCSTVVVGLILAKIMVRRNQLDSKTAVLGLLPGGSAGAIAASIEIGAVTEIVGFMQYFRVLFVTITAPLVYKFISADHPINQITAQSANDSLPYLRLVVRGDQIAGVCTTIVIAFLGYHLARKCKIPSASLFGPMLLSLIITLSGQTHGYAVSGLAKDVIFALVGLEVGLKFSPSALVKLYKLLPAIFINIIILCTVSGILAVILANLLQLPIDDVYLATTPGGINAVLGVAQTSHNNLSLITSAQSIRLMLSLLLLAPLIKLVNNSPKNTGERESNEDN